MTLSGDEIHKIVEVAKNAVGEAAWATHLEKLAETRELERRQRVLAMMNEPLDLDREAARTTVKSWLAERLGLPPDSGVRALEIALYAMPKAERETLAEAWSWLIADPRTLDEWRADQPYFDPAPEEPPPGDSGEAQAPQPAPASPPRLTVVEGRRSRFDDRLGD